MEPPFLSQFRSLRAILLKPEDALDTAVNHSRERYRRALLTSAASFGAKGISFATSILTVRWTLNYLGTERYGMWVTISSFLALLSFADLGLGNGLVNVVAEGDGNGDREAIQRAVSSALWMLIAVAAVLLCAGAAVYPYLHLEKLVNVHSVLARKEAGPALAMFFVCFSANLPLSVVYGAQAGLQRGYVSNLWFTAGSLGSLIALWIAIKASVGLPGLILALIGPGILFSALNGLTLFGISRPELRPMVSAFSSKTAKALMHVGLMYFILQTSLSVALQTDNLVIAQVLGSAFVAAYAVPARMFAMVGGILSLISTSMWPAYAEASARLEWAWIRKGFVRVLTATVGIAATACCVLIFAGNRILSLWVGRGMHASEGFLIALGIQTVILAYINPISVMLNGISRFRLQVILSIIMAAVNLCSSIFFVKRIGIVGAALGTIVATLTVQCIPLTFYVAGVLRKSIREEFSEVELGRESN